MKRCNNKPGLHVLGYWLKFSYFSGRDCDFSGLWWIVKSWGTPSSWGPGLCSFYDGRSSPIWSWNMALSKNKFPLKVPWNPEAIITIIFIFHRDGVYPMFRHTHMLWIHEISSAAAQPLADLGATAIDRRDLKLHFVDSAQDGAALCLILWGVLPQ